LLATARAKIAQPEKDDGSGRRPIAATNSLSAIA